MKNPMFHQRLVSTIGDVITKDLSKKYPDLTNGRKCLEYKSVTIYSNDSNFKIKGNPNDSIFGDIDYSLPLNCSKSLKTEINVIITKDKAEIYGEYWYSSRPLMWPTATFRFSIPLS